MSTPHLRTTVAMDAPDDDLVAAWRVSGWTTRQTWLLYLEVGGGESLEDVRRRLDGDRDWRGAPLTAAAR
jgi:hypothetical protein